jgi:hypothetical protein
MNDGARQKLCGRCGELKPLAAFSFKKRANAIRHSYCRACHAAWNRDHHERNRDQYIARAKRHNADYETVNTLRVIEYLLLHPCVDCGETDIIVLQFDHRAGAEKVMEVGRLVARCSGWARIAAEIAKCDVRCANCHQRRTAAQFGWRRLALKPSD